MMMIQDEDSDDQYDEWVDWGDVDEWVDFSDVDVWVAQGDGDE